jgi:large conductance mechanosensitive channel
MKKFFAEFRDFALRGNVFDMAIGVILATAFGKITTSLVNDLFMPFIGWLLGGIDLSSWVIYLPTSAVELRIGVFLTTVIDFILIAFVVFLLVKTMNRVLSLRKKPEEPAAPKGPTQEELLSEIRDLLKEQNHHDA